MLFNNIFHQTCIKSFDIEVHLFLQFEEYLLYYEMEEFLK